MGRPRHALAIAGLCTLAAACSTAPDAAPVVHIEPAVAPSPSQPLDKVLPTANELTNTLGTGGFMGQLVEGGPDMLLAGVRESEATPVECVGTAYRLERAVYQASPVIAVASQSWAGGSADGPSGTTGFFGAVRFATHADAQAFFATSADKWHRCNGQTLVLQQPEHGAQGSSRVADVSVDDTMVSAVVMRDAGSTIQRALGVAGDCVVDVEITDVNQVSDAHGAVGVADLMLQKVGTP